MRAGVIIAGGRSTRFGDADKAVAELAGTPMIRRVADRLTGVIDTLVVNCRADQQAAIEAAMDGYPYAVRYGIDPDPDGGPMVGIHTGLDALSDTDAAYAFVVACDMPFVQPSLVEHLFTVAETAEAAVPRVDDEWYQTTHAVYHVDRMTAACEAAIERGDRKILSPLFELDYRVVDDAAIAAHGGEESFENLNTRAEFEAAQTRLKE